MLLPLSSGAYWANSHLSNIDNNSCITLLSTPKLSSSVDIFSLLQQLPKDYPYVNEIKQELLSDGVLLNDFNIINMSNKAIYKSLPLLER